MAGPPSFADGENMMADGKAEPGDGLEFEIAGIAPGARVAMAAADGSGGVREMDSMMERDSEGHAEMPVLGQ